MARKGGAGPLRHRVAIQTATTTIDSLGQVTRVWVTTSTHRAEVSFIGGRKIMNAAQQKEDITHYVRMRWFKGLDSTMQLLFKGRVFSIIYINNIDERNIEYRLHCQEIVETT